MKQKITLIVLLLAIFCFGIVKTALAFTNPTHFVDSQWNLQDRTNGYGSIEVDITPEIEESTTTDGYYFANTVYFTNYTGSNFGGAYAGMQTNGFDGTKYIGKMAIFSVWDVSTGIAEPGGTGTSFGGEGSGYSVRLPFSWQVGTTYRLKIYIDQDAASGDRLWSASLTNLSSGTVTRVGRIYIPVARGKIYGPVTFHERYLGPTASCTDIKKSQVRFSNMTANNGANKATSWNHYAVAKIPECPGLTWLLDITNGYQSGVGTTKPVAAVAAPVVVTPTTKANPAPVVPTPVVTVPQVAKEPVKAETSPVVKQPKTVASTTPKKSYLVLAVLIFSIIIVAAGSIASVLYLRDRKFKAYLTKHFPFDPDIR